MSRDLKRVDLIRQDMAELLEAIKPTFVRESVLARLLENATDLQTGEKLYAIGSIRAVFNAYVGRSGEVPIEHVQGSKVGASTFYHYSYTEETALNVLPLEQEKLDNTALLFVQKDNDYIVFHDGLTDHNKMLIQKYNIQNPLFLDEKLPESLLYKVWDQYTLLITREVLWQHFLQTDAIYIEIPTLLLIINNYLADANIFDTIDADEFLLDHESFLDIFELLVKVDDQYSLGEDGTSIYKNNAQFSSLLNEQQQIAAIEYDLRNALQKIKQLQLHILEDGIEQRTENVQKKLKSILKIEKSLNKMFFH